MMRSQAMAALVAADVYEQEIRAELAAGRAARAVELVRRTYGQAIYGRALQMTRDAATAEDVAQEALMRIWQGLGALRDGTSVRAWVMTVVVHAALDELRRRVRRNRLLDDGVAAAEVADARPLAADALAAEELRRDVRRCVQTLSPRVRASVLLRFDEDLTYAEVGRRLDERGDTVQIRVHRALTRLCGTLRRHGIDGGTRTRRPPPVREPRPAAGAGGRAAARVSG
ncbi:MAG TPA: RNA polymerase sigma factor [Kofleriaceae bacterium]|nr:RNA polymerase sigma factor [Kofleriaceae bacterium]